MNVDGEVPTKEPKKKKKMIIREKQVRYEMQCTRRCHINNDWMVQRYVTRYSKRHLKSAPTCV